MPVPPVGAPVGGVPVTLEVGGTIVGKIWFVGAVVGTLGLKVVAGGETGVVAGGAAGGGLLGGWLDGWVDGFFVPAGAAARNLMFLYSQAAFTLSALVQTPSFTVAGEVRAF